MMGVQYFILLPANLTSVLISCEDKITHIMIAICLAFLIVHTLNIRVNHFMNIKFTNLDGQCRIWHKRTEPIYPKECILYAAPDTWWKPSFRAGSILKTRLAIACVSISSGTSVYSSRIQGAFYILTKFNVTFDKYFIYTRHGNPDVFGTYIHTYIDRLFISTASI